MAINSYWNTAILSHLPVVHVSFRAETAEWNGNRDCGAHRASTTSYLVLYRESLLTPVLYCLGSSVNKGRKGKRKGLCLWGVTPGE